MEEWKETLGDPRYRLENWVIILIPQWLLYSSVIPNGLDKVILSSTVLKFVHIGCPIERFGRNYWFFAPKQNTGIISTPHKVQTHQNQYCFLCPQSAHRNSTKIYFITQCKTLSKESHHGWGLVVQATKDSWCFGWSHLSYERGRNQWQDAWVQIWFLM